MANSLALGELCNGRERKGSLKSESAVVVSKDNSFNIDGRCGFVNEQILIVTSGGYDNEWALFHLLS